MIRNIKIRFMPKYYQLNLIRQLQNLRHKTMTVKENTKEFFRPSIRARHKQGGLERVARYINGLRYDTQDELSLLNLKTAEDAYQVDSKVEEKLLRKQNQRNMGKNTIRGRGSPSSGGRTSKDGVEGSSSQSYQRGGFRGGRGRGRHRQVKCYACGDIGHMSWNYPRNQTSNQEM